MLLAGGARSLNTLLVQGAQPKLLLAPVLTRASTRMPASGVLSRKKRRDGSVRSHGSARSRDTFRLGCGADEPCDTRWVYGKLQPTLTVLLEGGSLGGRSRCHDLPLVERGSQARCPELAAAFRDDELTSQREAPVPHQAPLLQGRSFVAPLRNHGVQRFI